MQLFRRQPAEVPKDSIHTPDYAQGIWITTPEGNLLSAFIRPTQEDGTVEAFTQGMLEAIDRALSKTGELPPRGVPPVDLNPDRGLGVRDDGSVRLALTIRYFDDNGLSKWPMLDSIVFHAAEWKQFAPPRAAAGTSFEVSPAVARQFCRILSPNSDTSTMPLPGEVTDVRIRGTVQAIENGLAKVSYAGQIAGAHASDQPGLFTYGQARLRGEGLYDVSGGQLVSFTSLSAGLYRHIPPQDRPRRTRGLQEWKANNSIAQK